MYSDLSNQRISVNKDRLGNLFEQRPIQHVPSLSSEFLNKRSTERKYANQNDRDVKIDKSGKNLFEITFNGRTVRVPVIRVRKFTSPKRNVSELPGDYQKRCNYKVVLWEENRNTPIRDLRKPHLKKS